MTTRNPVGWFEIYVEDMPRAKRFYEAVLGLPLQPLPSPEGTNADLEMYAFPMQQDAAGAAGALVRMPDYLPGAGGTIVYFACEDCTVQERRCAAHGGQVIKEKFSIQPYGFVALIQDTEGNMVGMHSMR